MKKSNLVQKNVRTLTAYLIFFFGKIQRASQPGGLSPRSQRLSVNIPKPHSQALAAIVKLETVRKQVKLTLEESRKVKELCSASLQRYFALLPADKVLLRYAA